MSATSGGGGSVSEGSEAGGSSHSTMSVSDSPSTSFQTSVPENVTKITLSEENCADGCGTDLTGSKINLSVDERHQKEGIVNVAFDYEEGTNRGSGNGDFRSINGSERNDRIPEAVNLELVNMVPYSNGNGTSYGVPVNGIPVKKDSEQVDMSTPYDEYFVPVNEHKKYMRGEKLYVTKDKRRPTSWRRCLSWIIACTVISVVLIIAILAGTGVILSQEPNLIKEASVGRNFAGSNIKPSVTNNIPAPTAEMHNYVPRSIESEFVIDNLDFDPAFKDRNSSAYKSFTTNLEDQLKTLLFDKEILGSSNVALKVVNISRDPFKVNYRIGWNYEQGANSPPDPIKMEDVKKRLIESLVKNQGYIDKYHIDKEAIKVNHVINTCQINNAGCSHICYFNYITQQFTCTCPTHLVLDNSNKNCVAWTGSSEDDVVPIPSLTDYPERTYESTVSPLQEYVSYHEHAVHQSKVNEENDRDNNSKSSSETVSEGFGDEHRDHEPQGEPAPEPTTETSSKQEVEHDRRIIYSSHGISDSEANPETTAESKLNVTHQESAVHSVHETKVPSAEPTSESTGEQNFDSNDSKLNGRSPFVSEKHEPSAEPTAEPTPEPKPETSSERRALDSVYEFIDHESGAEPSSEPTAERDRVHDYDSSFQYSGNDQTPTAEPTPEPALEPVTYENFNEKKQDYADHSIISIKDRGSASETTFEFSTEPTVDPNSESKIHGHDGHSVYESQDLEPATETTPELVTEFTAEHNTESIHHHDESFLYKSKDHEPSVESTPTSSAKLTPEGKARNHADNSDYEYKNQKPIVESIPEPVTKHTSEGDSKNKNQNPPMDSLYEAGNPESVTKPTPEQRFQEFAHDHDSYSVYESKSQETEWKVPSEDEQESQTVTNQNYNKNSLHPETDAESVAEPTFTPTDSDSRTSQHDKTSLPSAASIENVNSDSKSSLENSNQESSQGDIQVTEPKTEYPGGVYLTLQNESNSNYKSDHYPKPHLEDILIKKPVMNFEPQNVSIQNQNQNPLQNVELSANGEPVIEEIVISKSARNATHKIGVNSFPTIMVNESDSNSNNAVSEKFNNQNFAIVNHSDESSTKRSVYMTEDYGGLNNQNTQPEFATGHPKIIEYTEAQYSTPKVGNDKETFTEAEFEQIGNFKSNYATTSKSSDQDSLLSSQYLNAEEKKNNSKGVTLKTKDQKYKLKNLSQSNFSVTTVHPNVQHEYHMIPVSVEFASIVPDSASNAETKLEVRNQTEMPEINAEQRDKSVGNPNEQFAKNEHGVRNDLRGGQIFKKEEFDQVNSSETSTEPQLTLTTLLSIITPEVFEKMNGQIDQDTVLKEIENKNKTYLKPNQKENNETTKPPEEISNNIKDEVLDNEAFNTLLDKEYKNRESTPSDGKDIVNKYANKPLKPDKKKIKDYAKGEKIDSDKKLEVTVRPAVTPEDFILQKHVNGNENIFDLDYSLQNEHTTKHDGGLAVIDPHGIPGVSFKPHGISNHDLSILQTVSPDFKTETVFPSGVQEFETLKSESKIKVSDNKEGESKLDKEYKFDKDYKYEKQKISKKKDLKKKVGGKDGKNVELDDGRKYFTEISKDDWDVSQEGKDFPETTVNPSFEKITVQSERGVRNFSGSPSEITAIPESDFYREKSDVPETPYQLETKTKALGEITTEYPKLQSEDEQGDFDKLKPSEQSTSETSTVGSDKHMNKVFVDKGEPDESVVKNTFNLSSGSVHDGQFYEALNQSSPEKTNEGINSTTSYSRENATADISGTMLDVLSQNTTVISDRLGIQGESGQNITSVHKTASLLPEIFSENGIANFTTAHPTIIIHGQSGNLQDGHTRFANSTQHSAGNATIISTINGTLSQPDVHSFSFPNYTATFSNGSTVHPTIVVRGQSGALQDGHESRFGNSTFQTFTTSTHPIDDRVFKNSQVYRIENSSLPGTVFDGHFNSQEGHYHMFTNSSGTFAYTNTSAQPVFRIRGESGDFGNSTAYILGSSTNNTFSAAFVGPNSVVFRNSTVFAVENNGENNAGVREIILKPHNMTSNETIHFTHQMSPSFVSSGTAYKVNNYFGYISKCAAGQFQCVNGTSKRGSACINLSSKCDSISDCSDGSDESGCIENGCPGNFQCSDSTCLKRNLVCNGILDCSDGSDEKNCEGWKCEFDEFQCPSGRCIPVVWQCDNKPDCDNHTDEYNCQTSCGNDEYLCPEGWCIPLTYKCNGVKECTNGEDELLCDCSHEEFKCQTGGCVSMRQVCDSLDDCPDRSDEWNCIKIEPSSNLLKIRSASGNYEPVCADNWSSRYSDEVCTSLGYFSSAPTENENSSITTETSFYILKNDTTADFNKKIIINLRKSEGNCSSRKLVEINCQEFSCGSRSMTESSSVEARLVGGMSATAGQWPSVALLYNIRNFHSCTANVLTPRWVLASYNCLRIGNFRIKNLNEQDWKFFGGSTVFEAERENSETRRILSIIPHPQVKFNQFLFTNDLALVELDQPLQFTNNLGAVCLPEQEMQPRQICVTAGWGMNTPEDKVIRQQLQYLPVPTMNLTECNSTEHYSGFLTEDKICAGYNSAQKSLCYNEEGAPLMCVNDKGEWELQGVLSYHSNCGRGSHPSIFSSITPVTDWIKNTIGNNFERKSVAITNR